MAMAKNDIGILIRGHFLFNRWRPEKYWFSTITVVRNFTIALFPMVIPEDQLDVAVFLMLASLQMSLLLMLWHKPRRTPGMNALDLAISFVQITLLGAGAMSVYGTVLGAELSTLVMILVIGCLLTGGLMVLWKGQQYLRNSNANELFICHHGGAGGSAARVLQMIFAKIIKGPVFYDVDHLPHYGVIFDNIK